MQKVLNFINIIFPLRDFLYILQLEEYDLGRYFRQVGPRLLKRNFEVRGQLDFTLRIKLSIFVVLMFTTFIFTLASLFSATTVLLTFFIFPFITPYLVGLSTFVTDPPMRFLKNRKIRLAHRYFVRNYPKTKIIAVTGSYGKTTAKYFLYDLLKYNYQVAIIPKNINTTLGVANYLTKGFVPTDCEYLIVEMGAFVQGDIAEMAHMLPPDISLITKMGDQHLERFGSFSNLVKAKYEIFSESKVDAKKYTSTESLNFIKENGLETEGITSKELPGNVAGTKQLAIEVATDLGVSDDFIKDTLTKFQPPERRNQIYVKDGVTVIDNSYNISPQTAKEMLHEAKRYSNNQKKKLVVMTGGISEQGSENEKVNRFLGELLNEFSSRVLLNPTIYKPFILQTLTVPYEIAERKQAILDDLSKFVNGEDEVLLLLPAHTDLAYL